MTQTTTTRTDLGDARPPDRVELGDGLVLRRWTPADVEALAGAVVGAAEFLRPWMPWVRLHDADGPAAAADFLAGRNPEWADGSAFAYAVVDGTGAVLGSVAVENRVGPGALEIGYWLVPAATGHGVMTRAVRALAATALDLPGVNRVEVHHDAGNTRSGAVPARLGWRREREEPREVGASGEVGTTVVWVTSG